MSAAAGVRSMTASSGPGISLMQEGISYMAGSELPCVVADITRGGPGLGNIAAEQSDYNQVVKGGGHGNYRTIVLAPHSVQEMVDLGAEVPREEAQTLVAYLAKNWPPKKDGAPAARKRFSV